MEILKTVLLGVGTVFVGLICLVLIIELTHGIIGLFTKNKAEEKRAELETAPDKSAEPEIEHGHLVACIATAVAEELGTDVSAIRIHSIRRI